jgi:hypothetical protein
VPEEIVGHGSRHQAGWAISKMIPDCISIVLSQDGDILIFENGRIIYRHTKRQYTTTVHINNRSIFSYEIKGSEDGPGPVA